MAFALPRRTFLGLAAAGLAACHKPGGPATTSLVLGDQQRSLRIMADAAKAFEGAPYRVSWANFTSPTPLFEAVSSSAVDTVSAIDNLVLLAAALGRPIKIVQVGASGSKGIGVLVPRDSPIRSIAELKGREVIVSTAPGGTADAVLFAAVREAGLKPTDIRPGYMLQPDAFSAFEAGKITAWATNDPWMARAQASGARLLRDGEGVNKGVTFLAATDKALSDPGKRAALGDALIRFAKARLWALEHADDYARSYAAQTGLPLEITRTTLRRRGDQPFSPVTPAVILAAQAVADDYASRGLFPAKVDDRPYFDASVFKGP
jgi:sulfonate transport system substrate-binding protein